MDVATTLFGELSVQVARIITGKLLTKEQIKTISSHSVGRYISDIFPEGEEQKSQRERMMAAQSHIENASRIIDEMKDELLAQKQTLEDLITEIDEKRSTAKKYSELAKTNQDAVDAIKSELEASVRKELIFQSEKGQGTRRVVSILLWGITLILGAALGSYFKEIVAALAL